MSDDQERRISDLERQFAVHDVKLRGVMEEMERGRKDTNARLVAMHADFKQSMIDQSNAAHRRTVLIVTIGVGALSAIIQAAGIVLG